MSSQLSGRLRAVWHTGFVGRVAEKDPFQAALIAPELPFVVPLIDTYETLAPLDTCRLPIIPIVCRST